MAQEAQEGLPPGASGVTLRSLLVNGRRVQFADTGNTEDPLVLFLHGWPASWYLWRRQLSLCAAHGWRGVAPDMRGFGGTEGSESAFDYNVYSVSSDFLGLVHLLGYERCVLVGHDAGAHLTWQMALLFPKVFVAVCAMSVPYFGRPKEPMLTSFKKLFGNPTDKEKAKFFYILHHQLPEAVAGYEANARKAIRLIYSQPGDPTDPPEVTDPKLWIEGEAVGMWNRGGQPKSLPPWLPEEELDHTVAEFSRNVAGSLKWYQKFDIDWSITPHLAGKRLPQPVLFIAGTRDAVIHMGGGPSAVEKSIPAVCEQTPRVVFVRGSGHWVQLSATDLVNKELFGFLAQHRPQTPGPLPRSRL
uniref:AB hydrolase-1 domain-containing protein n=1 Tax=Alexandrium catenella TaxID=2925 RepID=A0A7S1MMA2_ALECA